MRKIPGPKMLYGLDRRPPPAKTLGNADAERTIKALARARSVFRRLPPCPRRT